MSFNKHSRPSAAKTHSPHRPNERGVGLVESLIGLLVLTIVLLTATQLLRIHVQHLALSDRVRRGDVQANAALNTLAAFNFSSLPDSNPFQGKNETDPITPGEQVSLNNDICLAQANCDLVVQIPQTSNTESQYIVVGWNQHLPTNGTTVYYRAWRVTTLDANKGLRRITLAILPAEQNKTPTDSVEPIALRQTDVVQHQ